MLHLNKTVILKDIIFNKNILRFFSSAINENLKEWNQIKLKYSDKQLIYVLKQLNKCNMNEIKKHGITENEIKIFESIKQENRSYSTLDDIILHDVMKVSELDRICENITTKMIKKSKKPNDISTIMGKKNFKNIKTAIGIRIGTNYVSWSELDLTNSNCNILNWNCQSVFNTSSTASAPEVIKMAMNIANSIPNASAYVMEKESSNIQSSKISHSLVRLLFKKQQLISGILTTLFTRINAEQSNETPSSFYMMRPFTSAQYFKLFLGKETVSSTKVVEAILTKKYDGNGLFISVTDKVLNYYHTVDCYSKEELNITLLLTITFVQKVVLENMLRT